MAKQVSNVANAVQNHGGSFQGKSPGNDIDSFRDAHGSQHFWPEHATISHFHPFSELLAV